MFRNRRSHGEEEATTHEVRQHCRCTIPMATVPVTRGDARTVTRATPLWCKENARFSARATEPTSSIRRLRPVRGCTRRERICGRASEPVGPQPTLQLRFCQVRPQRKSPATSSPCRLRSQRSHRHYAPVARLRWRVWRASTILEGLPRGPVRVASLVERDRGPRGFSQAGRPASPGGL